MVEQRRTVFRGRLLAREREHTPDDRLIVKVVYLTAKGQFALYTKTIERWSAYSEGDWEGWDWSTRDYRLDVYETLEQLQPHVSRSLVARVTEKLQAQASAPELLDI